MAEVTRILIVDDDAVVAEALNEQLIAAGYACLTVGDGHSALRTLADGAEGSAGESNHEASIGVVIVDLNLPDIRGMDLLRRIGQEYPAVCPIVVSGFGKIESAVEAMKLGAIDYLTKPIEAENLRQAVSRAVDQHALLRPTSLREADDRAGLANLVGSDLGMQKVYDLVEAVAPSRTTVLISGASGTGKTMAARAIHTLSPRSSTGSEKRSERSSTEGKPAKRAGSKNAAAKRAESTGTDSAPKGGPFLTFSCGSIPEALAESELFGHVRGAFTGADYDKPGKILSADGGTLFIDEINSASPALQMKLLRVLQERAFEPVGSTQTRTVDVRFVLAANRDLAELVRRGDFREDLYYRINVVNIHMPSLQQRPGDIDLLADHFLERYCAELQRTRRLSDPARRALHAYAWPGNVRELENAVERAVVLSRGPRIEIDDLPETVGYAYDGRMPEDGQGLTASLKLQENGEGGFGRSRNGSMNADGASDHGLVLPDFGEADSVTTLNQAMSACERELLLAALEANDWNRQTTSGQLGINRTTLYKKIRHHRLDEPAGVL